MDLAKLWVLEWSAQQNALNVCPLEEMIAANRELFFYDRDPAESDWRVIAIAPTRDALRPVEREMTAQLDRARKDPPPDS